MGRRYSGGATLCRAHRAHARQRPRQVLHRQAGPLPLDDPLRDRSARPSRRSAAMDFDGRGVRQLTSHKSIAINPNGVERPDRLHLLRPPLSADLDDGPRRRRQARDFDGRRAQRLAFALARRHRRSPSPARPRATRTSTRSASRGGPARRLTTSRALEASPAWSPTGRQILYTSDLTGTPQIYVMDAEGTGSRRVTLAGNWNDEGAWSPDGSRIAFACRNEGDFNICVMDFVDRPDDPDHLRGLERPPVLVARRREDRVRLAAQRIDSDLHDGRERAEQAPADARRQPLLSPWWIP